MIWPQDGTGPRSRSERLADPVLVLCTVINNCVSHVGPSPQVVIPPDLDAASQALLRKAASLAGVASINAADHPTLRWPGVSSAAFGTSNIGRYPDAGADAEFNLTLLNSHTDAYCFRVNVNFKRHIIPHLTDHGLDIPHVASMDLRRPDTANLVSVDITNELVSVLRVKSVYLGAQADQGGGAAPRRSYRVRAGGRRCPHRRPRFRVGAGSLARRP